MERAEENPIKDLKAAVSSIQKAVSEFAYTFIEINGKLEQIADTLEQQQEGTAAAETTAHSSTFNDEKLSDVAKAALSDSGGPLNVEELKNFLMDEAWGKPRPPILPIVRRHTKNVQELLHQIKSVKDSIQAAHMIYKSQRQLDVNLNVRIDRLLKNAQQELDKEAHERLHQRSMEDYVMK